MRPDASAAPALSARPRDDDPREAASSPRRVQLFVNPAAGSCRRAQLRALKAAFEAAGAAVLVTPSEREPLAVADSVDHVCAVGGDGTIRHVAAAVARADPSPSMSVYPLGTVNLLARECGYRPGAEAFVRRVMGPARRRHYHALLNGAPMLTCASVGPETDAIARVSPALKRLVGRGAYLVAFAGVLARWPRRTLRVVADGCERRGAAVYVAKGRYFAGPWSFAPAAAVDDRLLHVLVLERTGRLAFLRFAWALLRGRTPRDASRFTCTALSIEDDGEAPVQADGDVVARLPVRIAVTAEPLAFA